MTAGEGGRNDSGRARIDKKYHLVILEEPAATKDLAFWGLFKALLGREFCVSRFCEEL